MLIQAWEHIQEPIKVLICALFCPGAYIESATRPIQSISCSVCLRVCLSFPARSKTVFTGDFWSKSLILKLQIQETLFLCLDEFLDFEICLSLSVNRLVQKIYILQLASLVPSLGVSSNFRTNDVI